MRKEVETFLDRMRESKQYFQSMLENLEQVGVLPDATDGMLTWVTHHKFDTERVEDSVVVSVPLGQALITGSGRTGSESNVMFSHLPANKEQVLEIEEKKISLTPDGAVAKIEEGNRKVMAVKQRVFIWSPQSRAESTTMWFLKDFQLTYEDTAFDNSPRFMSKTKFDESLSQKYALKLEPL